MTDSKFLLILLMSTCTLSVGSTSNLEIEGLIGGYPAFQLDFKYQAAILGKYNFTNFYNLLCSAGIIGDYFLLSAARCFIHMHHELKRFIFYAATGTDVLMSTNLIVQEIDKIYTYSYRSIGDKHDVAVIRLKESLNLQNNTHLDFLRIPNPEEVPDAQSAIVAGYGINLAQERRRQKNREQIRIRARSALLLKYAEVTIIKNDPSSSNGINDTICNVNAHVFDDICGIIQSDEIYDLRGICMGDNGAPLVIGNKVIGIVSRHRKDCDDTIEGTVYKNVADYTGFIYAILEGIPIIGTMIHNNPMYMSYNDFIDEELRKL